MNQLTWAYTSRSSSIKIQLQSKPKATGTLFYVDFFFSLVFSSSTFRICTSAVECQGIWACSVLVLPSSKTPTFTRLEKHLMRG